MRIMDFFRRDIIVGRMMLFRCICKFSRFKIVNKSVKKMVKSSKMDIFYFFNDVSFSVLDVSNFRINIEVFYVYKYSGILVGFRLIGRFGFDKYFESSVNVWELAGVFNLCWF